MPARLYVNNDVETLLQAATFLQLASSKRYLNEALLNYYSPIKTALLKEINFSKRLPIFFYSMPARLYVNNDVETLLQAATFLQLASSKRYLNEALLNYYSPIYEQPICLSPTEDQEMHKSGDQQKSSSL
jgi:hypothetical protein